MKADFSRAHPRGLLTRAFTIGLLILCFRADSAETSLEVLVPSNPLTDFSIAVSTAISSSAVAGSNFLFHTTPIPYQIKSNLISQIQSKVNNLESTCFLLILGPASTDEALALEASITNANDRVLFLSPSVSTKQQYKNLRLFGACLPDSERIDYLGKNAPKQWKGMSAVFVGEDGAWGLQLYTNLCAQTNYFTVRAPGMYVHTKEQSSGSEYEKIATHCVEDNVHLIFLALGDPQNVKIFLKTLKKQRGILGTYRPCVCLLGDYRFVEGNMDSNNNPQIITEDFASVASIVMASEAQMNHEGANLFVDLDADLLSLLGYLYNKVDGNPRGFFSEIETTFGSTTRITVPTSLRIASSHYLSYRLGRDDAWLSGVNLKWLEDSFTGKPRWQLLTPQIADTRYYWDVARSRVPWLAAWWMTGVVTLTISFGWFVEFRKRFVFLQKRFASRFLKCLSWFLIILVTLLAIFGLCWTGFINPAGLGWVLAACMSPMALLPMLQHLAFAKIPALDRFLELPSVWIEKGLDICINSRAKDPCAAERVVIEEALNAQDPSKTNAEGLLWGWWIEDLRRFSNQERAQKVTMRFFSNVRPWDASLAPDARVEKLKDALAYTRVVLRSQTMANTNTDP
jgi:hypothetical protein